MTLVLDHERHVARRIADDTVAKRPADMGDRITRRDPVDAYVRFVHARGSRLGLERGVTSRGVVYLAGALSTLAEDDGLDSTEVRVALLDLNARGRVLAQLAPDRLTHAEMSREAFVWASSLLGVLQKQQEPANAALAARVDRLASQARAIRTDQPLSVQHPAVLTFFQGSADLLKRLAGGKPHEEILPVGS
jgi:hypothetical protein